MTTKIPYYNDLAHSEKHEIDKAMEDAYGINIYNNWRNAKHLLLLHIKHHMTIIGTTTAIFARDEYQTSEGNLSHNHLILAINKSTLNENSEQYIQDLIRTSVLEIIKTDSDLPRLINNGMLRRIEDVAFYVELATKILVHICNERCKIKARDGDTKDTLECRKIHPVKGSRDPTKHTYTLIATRYQQTTIDILEDIGLVIDGIIDHPYFQPKRHMPPCNFNATCNMLPVIPDFLLLLGL